jgi:hypothetical protein
MLKKMPGEIEYIYCSTNMVGCWNMGDLMFLTIFTTYTLSCHL